MVSKCLAIMVTWTGSSAPKVREDVLLAWCVLRVLQSFLASSFEA